MAFIPTEVLQLVTHHACGMMDGGHTACTLRATARVFHQLVDSDLTRFRVVSVAGSRRIQSLFNILKALPAHARIVEHLFVSDSADDVLPTTYNSKPGLFSRLLSWTSEDDNANEEEVTLTQRTMEKLCQLCAPSLISLTIATHKQHNLNWLTLGAITRYPPLTSLAFFSLVGSGGLRLPEDLYDLMLAMPALDMLVLSGWRHFRDVESVTAIQGLGAAEFDTGRYIRDIHLEGVPDESLHKFVQHHYLQYADHWGGRKSVSMPQILHVWPVLPSPDDRRQTEEVMRVVREISSVISDVMSDYSGGRQASRKL
jgi:hypothetical protein